MESVESREMRGSREGKEIRKSRVAGERESKQCRERMRSRGEGRPKTTGRRAKFYCYCLKLCQTNIETN